jgi:hypothetical protein
MTARRNAELERGAQSKAPAQPLTASIAGWNSDWECACEGELLDGAPVRVGVGVRVTTAWGDSRRWGDDGGWLAGEPRRLPCVGEGCLDDGEERGIFILMNTTALIFELDETFFQRVGSAIRPTTLEGQEWSARWWRRRPP